MTTEATTFSRPIKSQEAPYKTFTKPKPNYQQRVRSIIEQSDWDEVILVQEEWINKLCIGVIIVASLYFIPYALATLFLA
jgi:hypothetical protein